VGALASFLGRESWVEYAELTKLLLLSHDARDEHVSIRQTARFDHF
jgi:hypothetical protein